jgi:hypothetical protein
MERKELNNKELMTNEQATEDIRGLFVCPLSVFCYWGDINAIIDF